MSCSSEGGEGSTDEQLMERLASGEDTEAALSVLYGRYGRTVHGTGLKLLGGDRSLAEELVQEVFLKVWRSSRTFDSSRGGFSTWLYRVTRSAAVDLHRRHGRGVARAHGEGADVADVRDPSAGPQQVVDESWLAWRMMRALETLEDPYRQALELAYFHGLSQREIAQKTGWPIGTVKTRTYRALKRLREELGNPAAFREVL